MAIRWTDAMSVGLEPLDHDHQFLIELINRVVTCDPRMSSRTVPDVIQSLVAYTTLHFQREETVLEAARYPDVDAHRDEHEALASEVRALLEQYQATPDTVNVETLRPFLEAWLYHHILLQDMAYKPYIEHDAGARKAAAALGAFTLKGEQETETIGHER